MEFLGIGGSHDDRDVRGRVGADPRRGFPTGNTGQADIAIKAKVNQHKSQSGELLVPGVEVYPNPVINKSLQLKFTSLPAGEYNLELIYSNGMKQFLNSLQITEGKTTYSVNLPHFIAPGIYRLQVSGNDNIKFHKVLNVL